MSLTSETGNQHFVVLVDKVQETVSGDEGGNLLSVLDELDADALANGRVGLLGLDSHALHHDSLGVRGGSHGLGLLRGQQMRLVVLLVSPSVLLPIVLQLARSAQTVRLSANTQKKKQTKKLLRNIETHKDTKTTSFLRERNTKV